MYKLSPIIFSILTLLFGSGILIPFLRYIIKRIKDNDNKTIAIQLGVQALLRNQMIADYNHYKTKGYAPIYAKENFENMWMNYHALGLNGVMDSMHDRFMSFPTEPKVEMKGDEN